MPLIFLSHSSKDKPLARRIAGDLRAAGIDVWLDEWEILVGDSITQRISHGLDQATYVAVLLTVSSIKSGWVEKEWQSKIGQEAQNRKVAILPIRGDGCLIPTLLGDKRFADLRADYHGGVAELVAAIHGHARRHGEGDGAPAVPSAATTPAENPSRRRNLAVVGAQASLHVIVAAICWHLFYDWRQVLGLPIWELPAFPRVAMIGVAIGLEVTAAGLYRRAKWAWYAGAVSFVVVQLLVAGLIEYIQPELQAIEVRLIFGQYCKLFGPIVVASIVGQFCLVHQNSRREF